MMSENNDRLNRIQKKGIKLEEEITQIGNLYEMDPMNRIIVKYNFRKLKLNEKDMLKTFWRPKMDTWPK